MNGPRGVLSSKTTNRRRGTWSTALPATRTGGGLRDAGPPNYRSDYSAAAVVVPCKVRPVVRTVLAQSRAVCRADRVVADTVVSDLEVPARYGGVAAEDQVVTDAVVVHVHARRTEEVVRERRVAGDDEVVADRVSLAAVATFERPGVADREPEVHDRAGHSEVAADRGVADV